MELNWVLLKNYILAMLAVLNPIGKVPVWQKLTSDLQDNVRKRIAWMTVSTAGSVLLIFLLAGKYILRLFQMDLASFQVAGGILLLIVSIDMIKGSAAHLGSVDEKDENPKVQAKLRFRRVMVPLAIPMIAGPATITTVLVYGSTTRNWGEHGIMAGILIAALLLVFVTFSLSYRLEKKVDPIVFEAITRIFGVILAGLAIQLMVEGLAEIFPAWTVGPSVIKDDVNSNGAGQG